MSRKAKRAKVLRAGRSQVVRLPKALRFYGDTVLGWPQGYVESFGGIGDDFSRPPQGETDRRE